MISYDIYYLRKFSGWGILPRIAVDLLQCFPANCLHGKRNGLQVASPDHEMKKLTLALVALLASLAISHARIGDTMKEV